MAWWRCCRRLCRRALNLSAQRLAHGRRCGRQRGPGRRLDPPPQLCELPRQVCDAPHWGQLVLLPAAAATPAACRCAGGLSWRWRLAVFERQPAAAAAFGRPQSGIDGSVPSASIAAAFLAVLLAVVALSGRGSASDLREVRGRLREARDDEVARVILPSIR